jgi:hypothetical protein
MGRYHSKRNRLKLILFVCLFSGTLASLVASLYFFNIKHYLLIPTSCLTIFIVTLLLSIYVPKLRILTVNITVLIGLILVGELSLFLKARILAQDKILGSYNYQYFIPDPDLGYKITPKDKIYTSIKTSGDKVIYDVSYHIDKNGFRITPQIKPNQECTWFVGDSFTFGEGVNDNQSLPWLWAEHKHVNTVNFGIHGYGPHQVLRVLELSETQKYTEQYCRPNTIFLQLLPEHILRASGVSNWDKNGPWYDLDPHGHLYLKGKFSDKPNVNQNIYLQKSYIIKYIESKITPPAHITPHHWAVYKKIIQAIKLQADQMQADFILLLWDMNPSGSPALYLKETTEILNNLNIKYILASSLLGSDLKPENYFIPQDGHPNFKAYQMIAASGFKNLS